MTAAADPPAFDGHNDVLLKLWRAEQEGRGAPERLFAEGCHGHLDLPRMRAGGLAGGLFAIFCPSAGAPMDMGGDGYDLPLPDPMPQAEALPVAAAQAGILIRLDARGLVRLCRSAAEIEAARAEGRIAAVMHLEGAEAIDPEFRVLDLLHAAGLRSLGPVWSRDNRFAHGAPFAFPASPDRGPGLTELGRDLVRRCEARGILLDASHLTERGFRDLAETAHGPLVASHSNPHALCAHARNLTDAQLDLIAEREGLVGVNLATAFLRPDGRMAALDTLEPVVRAFAHLVDRVGEDRVGLGSDFDGAKVPAPIGDAAGLPALREALRAAGFDGPLLDKLFWGNWLRVLRAAWGG